MALVAHGHFLRVLIARWLRLEPVGGLLFRLETGTLSALGTEHDEPVIKSLNEPPCASRLGGGAGLHPASPAAWSMIMDSGQARATA